MLELNLSNLFPLLIFILLLIIFKLFNKTTKSNLPPSPPSLPILGHLHLLKQPLHETFHKLSQKLGPVMLLRFGVRRVLVVTSPSAVEECFSKSNDIVFANRAFLPSVRQLNYNFTTIGGAPYGHLWRSLRRVAASEMLSTTRLDATTNSREHEVKLLCRQIFKQSGNDQVELKSSFRDLLNNITTMSMMGKRYYGDMIDTEDLKSAIRLREMMGGFFKQLHTPNIGDFLPVFGWFDIGGSEKNMTSLMTRMDEFLDEVIQERRRIGSCESGIMVDKLIALQEQEPELYTDQIIKGFILVNLIFSDPFFIFSKNVNNPNPKTTSNLPRSPLGILSRLPFPVGAAGSPDQLRSLKSDPVPEYRPGF